MGKPKLFIGSSTEGLNVAKAIHQNLDHFAEVTIWNQNVFLLSTPIITSLVKALNTFDFAIFVFTPDDITSIRGEIQNTVRDNVIFETGLFAGKLGTNRVYFLKPRGLQMHLPSDLLGVIAGDYASDRTDNNLIAATATFCYQVEQMITEILQQPQGEDNVMNRMKKDLRLIEIHLKEKGWTSIGFTKISENIHPKLTENYLMEIIETFPEKIRRCKLGEGRFGIKLLQLNDLGFPEKLIANSFNFQFFLKGDWELVYKHTNTALNGSEIIEILDGTKYFINKNLAYILTDIEYDENKNELKWTKVRYQTNLKHSRETLAILSSDNIIVGTDDLGYNLKYTKLQ